MKLNVKSFALTCGLLWGMGVFFFTWWIILFEGVTNERTWLGRVYRVYTISPRGSVLGMILGFLDALTGGAVFAWLYNTLTGEASDEPQLHGLKASSEG
jgi:hypothetical protein